MSLPFWACQADAHSAVSFGSHPAMLGDADAGVNKGYASFIFLHLPSITICFKKHPKKPQSEASMDCQEMSCECRLPTRENYTMSQCEDFLNWTWKAFRPSFPVQVSFLLFCTASPVYCLEKIGVKKGSGRAPQEKVPPLDGWRCLVPNVFVSGIYNAEKEPASIHLDKWQRHAEMCSIV